MFRRVVGSCVGVGFALTYIEGVSWEAAATAARAADSVMPARGPGGCGHVDTPEGKVPALL